MTDAGHWRIERHGSGRASVLIHVPHAGTVIPDEVRADILVDHAELAAELAVMTDWHTDRIAVAAASIAAAPTVVFANRLSRLVVDPERFPDEREVMERVGMGAVYRTCADRTRLRDVDPARDAMLIEWYFLPYADALATLVQEMLDDTGRCTIIDVHSYPRQPLPYELDHAAPRPGVCVGTDEIHTPAATRRIAFEAMAGVRGGVAENTPFAGTYVPLRHYGRDRRVSSVMIEIRRDLYLDEPSTPRLVDVEDLAHRLARIIDHG